MRKLLSIVLVLTLLISAVPFSAIAEDVTDIQTETIGEANELLWEYEAYDDGVVLTTYTGSATDVYVPNYIEDGENKYAVLKLGDSLFENNDSLNSVTLGNGILEIGNRVFYDCDNMVCVLLAEETITIGDEAFYGCDVFNSIILYDAVTTIGTDAFAECTNLTVWCNEETTGYNYAVSNNIPYEILNPSASPETYVQDGITYYIMNGEAVAIEFDGNTTEVIVPSYVEGYPVTELRETFKKCYGLVSVVLPNGLKEIGNDLFYDCRNLVSVNIPDSVIKIGNYAFYWCHKLAEINMPQNIVTIGAYAFYDCGSLVELTLPNKITDIGSCAFSYCDKIEKVYIPESVINIGNSAFSSCDKLLEVTIPSSVVNLGESAFGSCESLETVIISEGIQTLNETTFYNCYNLKKVVLPKSVTSMSSTTFPVNTLLLVYEESFAHTFAVEEDLFYFVYDGKNEPEISKNEGITYVILDNKAIATGCDKSITDAVIPSIVNGYPVVELKRTFANCKNIKTVTLPDGITEISDYLFYYCQKLTNVNIPDSVNKIGKSAFYYCNSLQEINIPDGVTVINDNSFYYCSKLTEIDIPSGVTSIGESAFYLCNRLTNITIPYGVTEIGQSAFRNCESLTEIIIPSTVENIGAYAFLDCAQLENVTLQEGVKILEKGVFSNCTNLKKLILPKSVTSIKANAFPNNTLLLVHEASYAHTFCKTNNLFYFIYDGENLPDFVKLSGIAYVILNEEVIAIGCDNDITEATVLSTINGYPLVSMRETFKNCTNLQKVILPEGITEISDYLFYNCTSLKSVNIPDSVISIGNNAFCICDSLNEIIIPDGVVNIGEWAFSNCSSLTSITIPNSVISIGNSAFYWSENLVSVVLSENITKIPSNMFAGCYDLSKIVLPNGITEIGIGAFSNCRSLKNIVIPDKVKIIYDRTFNGCWALKNVTLPKELEKICNSAFYDCINLKQVVIPESITNISRSAFSVSSVLMVYENSYAHTFAESNDLLYFVMRKTENPEIDYGAGISGSVTYTDGTAVSGASVEIVYDDGVSKETVVTDENGAYEFTYAEVGEYTIYASDSLGNTASAGVSVKRMNVFDVFVTGDTDLILKKGYSVSGVVNIGSASVTITDTYGNIIDSVIADENGNFAFENVPNGEYIVKAETENGSATNEVTVFDGNITDIELNIDTNTASVWGYVEVEDRELKHHRRNWVQVTIYNDEGVVIGTCKTDKDGKYSFKNLPLGDYVIVAETSEMRPDKKHKYNRNHILTGFAYVEITEVKSYEVDTIVLYEENDCKAEIVGKVTAKGSSQISEVTLVNVFGDEIDSVTTKNNGKFVFKNVKDGMYFIFAVTESDGMGFAVVVVRNGNVYGETHIKIAKSDRIKEREDKFDVDFENICDKETAIKYKDRIAEEKRFYDGLSRKERKHLSKHYIEKLEQLSSWIADCEYISSNDVVSLQQGGLVVSGSEIENQNSVSFTINVTKVDAPTISTDGVNTDQDFINHSINDKAGNGEIKQYYEITMNKNTDGLDKSVTSVYKDTDSSGKFRITLAIPEEYRGYKHYSFVHEHHGEVVTLCDLDDNPETVTFEIDKFSTFVLTATDIEQGSWLLDGDIDANGAADDEDLSIMRKVLLGTETGKSSILNDVNNDDKINICDLVSIDEAI